MPSGFYHFAKRTFDLTLTLPALVLLSPILCLTALGVRLKLGAPILFRQERAGLGGRPFEIYKFRTMTDARDVRGNLLPDAERLPPFGRFLRASSLDELPQLLNVVKGEMSLVGPRPLFVRYIPRYSPEQFRRLEAKPGITGWAQIKGRNTLDWHSRFVLDTWYVDHRSLTVDLTIIAKTFLKVLAREGISAQEHATMPEFKGEAQSEMENP